MLENKRVTVVLDSQAGSCGKGKFIGYLAKRTNPEIAINNFMSNAGHTCVLDDGTKVMTQHLPTSVVSANTTLMIGPGAAITPHILFDEILKYGDLIGNRSIVIHPRAVVILEKHCEEEKKILRSGSTFKGCGAALADKVMRQAMLFGEWWNKWTIGWVEAGNNTDNYDGYTFDQVKHIIKHIIVQDTMEYINDTIDVGGSVIVEGSQGCDLDINYGLAYPNTTSRQCHAGQLVADCGISPTLVTDIIMIMRPYPIRISNTTNLKNEDGSTLVTSSGEYDGAKEITWDIVKERCGAPADVQFGEMTTVTKKLRRVFELNMDRLKYVTKLNRPTEIALNFAQYIDWDILGKTRVEDITPKVWEFIQRIEFETGVPVTMIGTGPRDGDIIDRKLGERGMLKGRI
jgi:adenylosuccinate synthase